MIPGAYRRLRGLVLAAVPLLLLGACAENAPQDTLDPKGPVARQIDNLINPVFVVAGVIFVVVQFLAIYAVVKYRRREDSPEPVQIHGNTRLELAWTLIPAFILLAVAVPTIRTIFDLAQKPRNALNVTVIGHQFWWEMRYDDLDIVTANELHIPVDRPVEVTLLGDATDVIHSFWVPALAGKTDVVPGRENRMHFEASEPGTYLGQCAEYCGLSHANMRLIAIAHPPAEFDAWVANQQALPREPEAGSPAAVGKELFVAKGCIGCHTIAGVSLGTLGPNLTHFATRTAFAGAVFDNTRSNLRRWLMDPPAMKPGVKMPDLDLTDAEVAQLIAYMETLQ